MTYIKGKPGFEEAKTEFVKTLPDHLKLFSKFLGENKWFTSEKLNYVDLLAYETFDWIRLLSPGTIEQFDNLSKFMDRFKDLPAIRVQKFKRLCQLAFVWSIFSIWFRLIHLKKESI